MARRRAQQPGSHSNARGGKKTYKRDPVIARDCKVDAMHVLSDWLSDQRVKEFPDPHTLPLDQLAYPRWVSEEQKEVLCQHLPNFLARVPARPGRFRVVQLFEKAVLEELFAALEVTTPARYVASPEQYIVYFGDRDWTVTKERPSHPSQLVLKEEVRKRSGGRIIYLSAGPAQGSDT